MYVKLNFQAILIRLHFLYIRTNFIRAKQGHFEEELGTYMFSIQGLVTNYNILFFLNSEGQLTRSFKYENYDAEQPNENSHSQVFDTINHDLLLAKLKVYEF